MALEFCAAACQTDDSAVLAAFTNWYCCELARAGESYPKSHDINCKVSLAYTSGFGVLRWASHHTHNPKEKKRRAASMSSDSPKYSQTSHEDVSPDDTLRRLCLRTQWLLAFGHDPTNTHIWKHLMTNERGFPAEIFGLIIQTGLLDGKDLKACRLVSSAFKEMATPTLFETVCFSTATANFKAWNAMIQNTAICRHVKLLVVDTAAFSSSLTDELYAKCASRYFQVDSRRNTQLSGAFAAANLQFVLRAPRTATWFGPSCLSGEALSGFRKGFIAYQAEVNHQRAVTAGTEVLNALYTGLQRMPNLTDVSVQCEWDRPPVKWMSKYEELVLASCPTGQSRYELHRRPSQLSLFPGPSAREAHPLQLPPNAGCCVGVLRVLFRALAVSRQNIRGLTVAGCTNQTLRRPSADNQKTVSFLRGVRMAIFEHALTFSHIPSMYAVLSKLRHFVIVINRNRCNDTRPGRLLQYIFSVRAALFSMRSLESLAIVMTGPCVVYSADRQMLDKSAFELILDDILSVPSNPTEPRAFHHIQPNPWPNLNHLTLHSMQTSWTSLITLLYTLRTTLTHLTLTSVTATPCPSNNQPSWSWLSLVYWITVFMPHLSSVTGGSVTGKTAAERRALYQTPGFAPWPLKPGEGKALLEGDFATWLAHFRVRAGHRVEGMETLRAEMGKWLRDEVPAPLSKWARGFFALRAEQDIGRVLGIVGGS